LKAAAFSYHRPETKEDALAMLGTLENARLLAGGQSLIAMLNTRYVLLDHLIDVKRIRGLDQIVISHDRITIGALAKQATVLADENILRVAPIFAEALHYVGHLQTRNRGTIGGSIAHMDPAAELMAVASALDATITAESARGKKEIPIADYPLGYMTPSLEPDEMITQIGFRLPAKNHGWAFTEFVQRHGDFAIVGVAVILEKSDAANSISHARIALIGMGPGPIRLHEAEALLTGKSLTPQNAEACAEIARRVDAMTDTMASAKFRQKLARVLTRRALLTAARRMNLESRFS
jgi:carbon-monoxide dehydrogenase medium subunit